MQTTKLSVTVKRHLQQKYDTAALAQINTSVKNWVTADAQRGIRTVHVALDDPAAMQALGVAAVSGKATATKIKRAIDKLWIKLTPDYLVLFGGQEIIPMFVVPNPSFDPAGDDDVKVPTDNPYASSSAYRSSKRSSYLVPDRVSGRIPDMPSDSSPAWLVDYLKTATNWTSKPASFYSRNYAICCDAWKGAGAACVQCISAPASSLFISPPTIDTSKAARTRLSGKLHMIKCHGSPLDPKFYGQKGNSYPEALTSPTLKSRIKPATVAAAMCCYGAQVFSPADPAATDPGDWPLAITYLRQGALGFVGSTMIAWVGVPQMMCADWIVAGYLKGVLGGASMGRAFLEAKQDYVRWINQQGHAPDIADEKTLIEYVLLGDPSIHPVISVPATPAVASRRAQTPKIAVAAQERHQRRVVRAQLAGQIRELLPSRTTAAPTARAIAKRIFVAAKTVISKDVVKRFERFKIRPSVVRVEKLDTPLPNVTVAAAGMRPARKPALQRRQSLEYYWSGRRVLDGHKQVHLFKAETDLKGNLLRAAVVHSS